MNMLYSNTFFQFPYMRSVLKSSLAIVLLIFGGFIYVVFRSEDLLMFNWFRSLGLNSVVIKLRDSYGLMNIHDWVKYNIPAGLWLFSYMLIIDSIWENGYNSTYKFFITILPVFAIISEVMQFFQILPGTFDIMDMIIYVFAIFLFLTIKLSSK